MARKPAPKSKKLAKSRQKTYTWRTKSKSKRKTKKTGTYLRKYISVFLLFIISFTFLFAFISFKKITQPLVSAYSDSSYDIRGEDIFALGVYEVDDLESDTPIVKKATISLFDTTSNKVLFFNIFPNTSLDVSGKYSQEELSKILGLGKSVNNDDMEKGIDVLNSSVSKYLGHEVNKYVVMDSAVSGHIDSLLFDQNVMQLLELNSLKNIDKSLITNMNFYETYYVYNFLDSLSNDKIQKIDLNNDVSLSSIDEAVRSVTFDSDVAFEKKSIAILNGTEYSGVASFGARVVENSGGRIVGTSNASKKYEDSILIVDDKDSQTTRTISRFFSNVTVIEKNDIDTVYDSEYLRADVILIIGLDIAAGL